MLPESALCHRESSHSPHKSIPATAPGNSRSAIDKASAVPHFSGVVFFIEKTFYNNELKMK
jgi:hypothetical protein